jgi:hypothetical protein
MAGAGTAAAAVKAVIDLRKSRRFIESLQGRRLSIASSSASVVPCRRVPIAAAQTFDSQ